ncbi:MAG: methylmalonyl Co-A mutase-associated GTPase MeaB, partial [Acidimicrobiales bacterium]
MPTAPPDDLLAAARGGDRGALARLISIIERGGHDARQVGRAAHGLGIEATTVGITGAPGAGKSTLTSALLEVVRATGDRIAVLAI